MAHYTNSMLLKGAAMALLAIGALPRCAFAQQQDPSSLPSSPTPKPQAQPQPQQGDSSTPDSSKPSPDAPPPDSAPPPPAPAPDQPAAKPPDTKRSGDDDGPQWSSSKKADSDSKDGEDDATDTKSKGKKSAKNAAADDDDESADASAKPKTAKPGVLAPETDPAWDPFHAAQDMDVGKFYMDKGDWDAAITRFEDAIRLRANFAKPREMMAEAYEKKGDKQEAVRYYKEYLQVLPNAPDAKKIQKKIEQLSAK